MEESNKFWEKDFNFIKGEYYLKIADICAKDSFQYDNAAVNYRKSVYAFTSGTAYYLNYYTETVPISEDIDDDEIFSGKSNSLAKALRISLLFSPPLIPSSKKSV